MLIERVASLRDLACSVASLLRYGWSRSYAPTRSFASWSRSDRSSFFATVATLLSMGLRPILATLEVVCLRSDPSGRRGFSPEPRQGLSTRYAREPLPIGCFAASEGGASPLCRGLRPNGPYGTVRSTPSPSSSLRSSSGDGVSLTVSTA